MTDHQTDLLAAYVLSTLSDDERVDLEEHLSNCEQCRHEAATMAAAAGLLPLTLEPAEPSVLLKQRLVAAASHGRSNSWPWDRRRPWR